MWLVAAIGVPLGLSVRWTVLSSLLMCSVMAAILWYLTRRRLAAVLLMSYAALLPVSFIVTIPKVNPNNPYVRQYNERLESISIESRLVGAPEKRVGIVLGNPTFIDSGWDRWDSETGEPTPEAEFVTTYNYAPYWFLPFSKFQVHCRDGIVKGIELYDD
jgi:hypothetical protein